MWSGVNDHLRKVVLAALYIVPSVDTLRSVIRPRLRFLHTSDTEAENGGVRTASSCQMRRRGGHWQAPSESPQDIGGSSVICELVAWIAEPIPLPVPRTHQHGKYRCRTFPSFRPLMREDAVQSRDRRTSKVGLVSYHNLPVHLICEGLCSGTEQIPCPSLVPFRWEL